MKSFVCAATLGILSTSPAFAWDAIVSGPDVFGNTTVLANEFGLQSQLVVQCSSEGFIAIGLLFPKKQFEEVPVAQADFYIGISDSQPHKLTATIREWNDNFAGVIVSDKDIDLKGLVGELRDAKGQIKVGADVGGNKMAENFSSRGSTASMNKIINGCKLAVP